MFFFFYYNNDTNNFVFIIPFQNMIAIVLNAMKNLSIVWLKAKIAK